jgi:hypothetical protein
MFNWLRKLFNRKKEYVTQIYKENNINSKKTIIVPIYEYPIYEHYPYLGSLKKSESMKIVKT